ncbi:MAG: hypothetical protein Q3980_06865 [Turicibacter sp.]|nr:hypothetical protein [Turicibacter sp.]MDO4925368.1 hypothetical protein [Turicibacter sp.]
MNIEDMKIVYGNSKDDNSLYNIFLDIMNFNYKEYEVDDVDRIIIQDTLKFIDRVLTSACKKTLGRIGIKGYSELNSQETKNLLKEHLAKQSDEIILKFYRENKVVLDMFKYEVCEVLNISEWRFSKIKYDLKISGTQVVNVCCKPKICNKYDRRFIYEILIRASL